MYNKGVVEKGSGRRSIRLANATATIVIGEAG